MKLEEQMHRNKKGESVSNVLSHSVHKLWQYSPVRKDFTYFTTDPSLETGSLLSVVGCMDLETNRQ